MAQTDSRGGSSRRHVALEVAPDAEEAFHRGREGFSRMTECRPVFVSHGVDGHSGQMVRGNGCRAAGAISRTQRERLFKLQMPLPVGGCIYLPINDLGGKPSFRGEGRERGGDAESTGESPSGSAR